MPLTAPDTGADPLANLRDIHLPADVSWWPPAPGWWLLAGLLTGACLWLLWFAWRRHRQRAYRRAALHLLQQLRRRQNPPAERLAEANALLKRTALAAWPAARVAALHGGDWCRFLSASLPRRQSPPANLEHLLRDGLYGGGAVTEADVEHLLDFCECWIRHHLPPATMAPAEALPC